MALIKPFTGVLLLYALWRRGPRAIAPGALAGLIVLILSFQPWRYGGRLVFWWLAASRYDASPAFAARNDNLALYGLFARLFTSTPFVRPLIDSPLLARALGLLLVALLIGAFARAVPRAGSNREGRLQLGKPAPIG